jgi:pimeloyl-ACP methyl ester carboxylesterase
VKTYAFALLIAGLLTATVNGEKKEDEPGKPIAVTIGDGGSGPYKAILAGDPTLPTHTIYRPKDLTPFGKDARLPIVLWGNGAGSRSSAGYRNFLTEIASHGFLVVAIGPAKLAAPGAARESAGSSKSAELLDGLNWAIAQNDKDGDYRGKLDTKKVAVMGHSLGGLQALEVSTDTRITTTLAFDSGVLSSTPGRPGGRPGGSGFPGGFRPVQPGRVLPASVQETLKLTAEQKTQVEELQKEVDGKIAKILTDEQQKQLKEARGSGGPGVPGAGPGGMGFPAVTRDDLKKLHGPLAYFVGGPSDIATKNAEDDFKAIKDLPVLLASRDVGHGGTFSQPNGGAFAVAGVAWLKWQLKGDKEAGKTFLGDPCGLAADTRWSVQRKNLK